LPLYPSIHLSFPHFSIYSSIHLSIPRSLLYSSTFSPFALYPFILFLVYRFYLALYFPFVFPQSVFPRRGTPLAFPDVDFLTIFPVSGRMCYSVRGGRGDLPGKGKVGGLIPPELFSPDLPLEIPVWGERWESGTSLVPVLRFLQGYF
jgi:hypothetical protein